jgi:hypothetical protein
MYRMERLPGMYIPFTYKYTIIYTRQYIIIANVVKDFSMHAEVLMLAFGFDNCVVYRP